MRSLILFASLFFSSPATADGCAGDLFAPDFPACVLSNLDAKPLTLTSHGGSVLISDYLATFITLQKTPVHITGFCKSACIPLLLASPEPSAEPDAVLAVHFHHRPLDADTLLITVQDTKEAWFAMTGNHRLWDHYIAQLQSKGMLDAEPTEDFPVPAFGPNGYYPENAFVAYSLAELQGFLSPPDR